jgi:energy-coupling factor transport system permease protein
VTSASVVQPRTARTVGTSLLAATSPLVKLGVAAAWLVGLAVSLDPRSPLVVIATALSAGVVLGGIAPRRLVTWLLPLVLAAVGLGVFNAVFAAVNADPAAHELVRLGPIRLTDDGARAGIALGLRVLAIASTSAVFVLTTTPTRLADALVQQARVPARFAYGALAAYQAVPRLAADLADLRAARRTRGLAGSWHPRVLLGLLVLAIRHADRVALAMDARAFGTGPRSAYRTIAWGWRDAVVMLAALAVLMLVLWAGGRLGQ